MKVYFKICQHCGREWVSCEVRTCPHNGRQICRYCCMKCEYSSNAGQDCAKWRHDEGGKQNGSKNKD